MGKLPALSLYLLHKNRESYIDTASIGAIPENEPMQFLLIGGYIVRREIESYVAEYFQYGMFQTELE